MKINFEIKFVREDTWIGVYHEKTPHYRGLNQQTDEYGRWFYICPLPCIVFKIWRNYKTT